MLAICGYSEYLPREAESTFGDHRTVHGYDSFHESCLPRHFQNCYFQDHSMTRIYRNEESHFVDGSQDQELTLLQAFAGG